MRRLPVGLALVALVVTVVLAMVTGSTASPPSQPPTQTAAVVSTTVVCPSINGSPSGTTTRAAVADLAGALSPPSTSTGAVTATVLAASKRTTQTLSTTPTAVIASTPKIAKTVGIYANGSVAASVAADQVGVTGTGRYRALTDSRCAAPSTDWWFVGADGRVGYTDTLILSNPSPTRAIVSITLWSPSGTQLRRNSDLQTVPVDPFHATVVTMASAAPDIPTLALHVAATSGSVTAALIDRRTTALNSDGADFLPPTQAPAASAVVAGFVAGQGQQVLVLANPGTLDATIGLKLVTPTGSFIPVGDNQLVVKAGHTMQVDLTHAFAGSTGAVLVSSNEPIAAEGRSVTTVSGGRPDFSWLAATAPLTAPAAVATGREPTGDGDCLLLLTAPTAAAEVRVSTPSGSPRVIKVAAGHSVAVNLDSTLAAAGPPQRSFVVTPVGSAPLYGVRVLSYASSAGELITSEPLVGLPTPTVLPPVQDDPRIATP